MPERRTNTQTLIHARELRKNLTPAERKLWRVLRGDRLGVSFRRQHAIGPFIADFCCIRHHLIIELDGAGHHGQKEYDAERTAYFESLGYRVIRFWNSEVEMDLGKVLGEISKWLPEV